MIKTGLENQPGSGRDSSLTLHFLPRLHEILGKLVPVLQIVAISRWPDFSHCSRLERQKVEWDFHLDPAEIGEQLVQRRWRSKKERKKRRRREDEGAVFDLELELEGGDVHVGQSSEKLLNQILLKSRVRHVHVPLQDGAKAQADPPRVTNHPPTPKHRSESCFLPTQTASSLNNVAIQCEMNELK